jgi:hypothetical protein
MSLEQGLIIVVTSLVVVIGILWRRDVAAVEWLKLEIVRMREESKDLVTRIRSLEDGRVSDERRHSGELKTLADNFITSRREDRMSISKLIAAVKLHRCLREIDPQDIAQADTEAITKNNQTQPQGA